MPACPALRAYPTPDQRHAIHPTTGQREVAVQGWHYSVLGSKRSGGKIRKGSVVVSYCLFMAGSARIGCDMVRGSDMPTKYVQKQHGVYRITDTHVSLDSIVHAWWAGQSAETIAQSFPGLTLEQIYGAITFYLAHKEEIDRYLEQQRADYEAKRQAARDTDPMFYQKMADKMADARRQLLTTP